VCSASFHEMLALVRSSRNVLRHVFFGRPLLRLSSSGVHDTATFEGRWLGRRSTWPAKRNLRSAIVLSQFSAWLTSFVMCFRYGACKILRRLSWWKMFNFCVGLTFVVIFHVSLAYIPTNTTQLFYITISLCQCLSIWMFISTASVGTIFSDER